MLHSLYTVFFLLGTAFGALLVGALLLIANELRTYDDARGWPPCDEARGGTIDFTSTEARAALTDVSNQFPRPRMQEIGRSADK